MKFWKQIWHFDVPVSVLPVYLPALGTVGKAYHSFLKSQITCPPLGDGYTDDDQRNRNSSLIRGGKLKLVSLRSEMWKGLPTNTRYSAQDWINDIDREYIAICCYHDIRKNDSQLTGYRTKIRTDNVWRLFPSRQKIGQIHFHAGFVVVS